MGVTIYRNVLAHVPFKIMWHSGEGTGGCLSKSGALGMSQGWGKVEAHQHEDHVETKQRNTGKKRKGLRGKPWEIPSARGHSSQGVSQFRSHPDSRSRGPARRWEIYVLGEARGFGFCPSKGRGHW